MTTLIGVLKRNLSEVKAIAKLGFKKDFQQKIFDHYLI